MNEYNYENIDISLREKVENIRLKYNHITSSHSFDSIAIWAKSMDLNLFLDDDFYVVKCNKLGNNHWFFPCGNKEKVKAFINSLINEFNVNILDSKDSTDELIKDNIPVFHYMREEDVLFLNDEFKDCFRITMNLNDNEYILDRDELHEMSGKRFKYIRNQVHQCERDYNISYKPIKDYDAKALFDFLDGFLAHKKNNAWIIDDYSTEYLINNLDLLNASGLVILIDDEPYAIAAGYPLSEDMFDFSFTKQHYPLGGMGAYIKYRFIEELPGQYKYINIEEDLGVEGLREMKQLLRPCKFIEMFDGVYNL